VHVVITHQTRTALVNRHSDFVPRSIMRIRGQDRRPQIGRRTPRIWRAQRSSVPLTDERPESKNPSRPSAALQLMPRLASPQIARGRTVGRG
jgi:hypothetical protein